MPESSSASGGTPTAQRAHHMSQAEWQAIERDPAFQELVATKRRLIVPATVFFIVFYFGFLVIVGYFPSFAEAKVFGSVNVAYLFALAQFIVAWILMAVYVRRANVFDEMASRIVQKVRGGRR